MYNEILLCIGLGLIAVFLGELGIWVVQAFRQFGRDARVAAEREAARKPSA